MCIFLSFTFCVFILFSLFMSIPVVCRNDFNTIHNVNFHSILFPVQMAGGRGEKKPCCIDSDICDARNEDIKPFYIPGRKWTRKLAVNNGSAPAGAA